MLGVPANVVPFDPRVVSAEQAANEILKLTRAEWELAVEASQYYYRLKTFNDSTTSLAQNAVVTLNTDSFKNSEWPFELRQIGVTVVTGGTPLLSDIAMNIQTFDGDYIVGGRNRTLCSNIVMSAAASDNFGSFFLPEPLIISPEGGFKVEVNNIQATTRDVYVALIGYHKIPWKHIQASLRV